MEIREVVIEGLTFKIIKVNIILFEQMREFQLQRILNLLNICQLVIMSFLSGPHICSVLQLHHFILQFLKPSIL
jgi:hypothetical protein